MIVEIEGKEIGLHFGMLAYEHVIGKANDFANLPMSKAFIEIFHGGSVNYCYKNGLNVPDFSESYDLCEILFAEGLEKQNLIFSEWENSLANKKLTESLNQSVN